MDIHLSSLSSFLKEQVFDNLKIEALRAILGLTGTKDGGLLLENNEIIELLIDCLSCSNELIQKTACLALVNISSSERGAYFLLNRPFNDNKKPITIKLLIHILNPESAAADAACMTLSNLTREVTAAGSVLQDLLHSEITISELVNAFTLIRYNNKGCDLHYLACIFANLSQNIEFRRLFMNENTCLIKKILPYTCFQESLVRRRGIVATLRNCCFDSDFHKFLLGQSVDILSHLLLPLAGSEELSEEETEKLPVDLQYLDENKERESDPGIRKLLLDALLQLCATKFGRVYFRNKNVYVVLREYHKWEKDRNLLLACENIVDILIRTEEEINEENLKDIKVPIEYVNQFDEMDKSYLQED